MKVQRGRLRKSTTLLGMMAATSLVVESAVVVAEPACSVENFAKCSEPARQECAVKIARNFTSLTERPIFLEIQLAYHQGEDKCRSARECDDKAYNRSCPPSC